MWILGKKGNVKIYLKLLLYHFIKPLPLALVNGHCSLRTEKVLPYTTTAIFRLNINDLVAGVRYLLSTIVRRQTLKLGRFLSCFNGFGNKLKGFRSISRG